MKRRHFALATVLGFPYPVARENEGGEGGTGEGGTGEGAAAPVNVGDTNAGTVTDGDGKVFTQAEVNEFVVKRNKALKAQYESLESNYEGLLKQQNLTNEQRSKLESELEGVRAALRTKEEQAKHEAKLAASKHQQEVQSLTQERDQFRNMFQSGIRDRAILEAAQKHDAFNPQQFIPFLSPRTKVIDELDAQGNKTGNQVPVVEVTVTGDDGTPKTVQKSVEDAVADLKASDPNLFKNGVATGIGEGSNPGVAQGDLDLANMSDEEYFANYDAIQKKLGLERKRF